MHSSRIGYSSKDVTLPLHKHGREMFLALSRVKDMQRARSKQSDIFEGAAYRTRPSKDYPALRRRETGVYGHTRLRRLS